MRRPFARFDLQLDRGLLLAVIALMGIGLVQVYSSSFVFAIDSRFDALHFFRKQLLFAGLGVAAFLVAAYFPQRLLLRLSTWIWLALAGLIGLTLIPGFGISAGGAKRWLDLPGSAVVEPSEFLKLALCLLLARWIFIQTSETKEERFQLRAWHLAMLVVPMYLTLRQPDFGSLAIMTTVAVSLLFVYGLRWIYISGLAVAVLPALYFLVWEVPYRRARVLGFLDPWSQSEDKSFQVIQSMMSFQSGGIWGVGLGEGQGKLFFLPEAHTDFTLAVLGEETGFVGFLVVLVLMAFLIVRGLQISAQSENNYSKTLALGLTLVFAFSVLINCGVVLGLLPTKGLALPFLSYGGSSLLANSILFGLLANIERSNRLRLFLDRRFESVIR